MIGTLGLAIDPGIQDSPHEWWAHKTIVEPFVAVARVARWTNPGRLTNFLFVHYRPRVDEAIHSMNPPGKFVVRSNQALVDSIVRFAVEIAH